MKLLDYKKLEGKIKLLSGLHIGGNKDTIEIGGLDNPVIKHPITGMPYIPGSSIKGKMRFLLEWKLGKVNPQRNGETCSCPKRDCQICRIFGSTHKEKDYGPTRIRLNDCPLSEKQENGFSGNNLSYFEDKVENRINRLTGTAIDPRHMERVPAGFCFDFGLTYKIFQVDRENQNPTVDEQNWSHVIDALYLVQEDALGGSGSRGYGRIAFIDLKLDGQEVELNLDGKAASLVPIQQTRG